MLFCDKSGCREEFAKDPCVVKFNERYYLYYSIWFTISRFFVAEMKGIGMRVNLDTRMFLLMMQRCIYSIKAV